MASNTAPDIFQIDGMYVPLAYPNLTPIDSYVSKDERQRLLRLGS